MVDVADAAVMTLVGAGTTMAWVKVALVAGVSTHSQRPSAPFKTTRPEAAVAPLGTFSTQGDGGVLVAVVPKVPEVPEIRLDVDVPVPTVIDGSEFRSTIGADAKVALMVLTSVSVSAPPPILPRSFVTMVRLIEPAAAAENVGAVAFKNALIAAIVPLNVMELVPLPVTVTPPPEVAAKVPDETVSCVVTATAPEGESGSATASPDKTVGEPTLAV